MEEILSDARAVSPMHSVANSFACHEMFTTELCETSAGNRRLACTPWGGMGNALDDPEFARGHDGFRFP